MKTQILAHFNKQTKDSKKELVQFYVKGQDENRPELNSLCREVVELSIDGVEASLIAEFAKKTQDAKKTAIEFIIKGDTSAAQSYEFYRMAGADVTLTIAESQMSIEEFRGEDEDEEHEDYREGVRGKINPDGTVDVDSNQLTIDEVAAGAEPDPAADATPDMDDSKVSDIGKERDKRKTKAEKEAEAVTAVAQQTAANAGDMPFTIDDDNDSLPF